MTSIVFSNRPSKCWTVRLKTGHLATLDCSVRHAPVIYLTSPADMFTFNPCHCHVFKTPSWKADLFATCHYIISNCLGFPDSHATVQYQLHPHLLLRFTWQPCHCTSVIHIYCLGLPDNRATVPTSFTSTANLSKVFKLIHHIVHKTDNWLAAFFHLWFVNQLLKTLLYCIAAWWRYGWDLCYFGYC